MHYADSVQAEVMTCGIFRHVVNTWPWYSRVAMVVMFAVAKDGGQHPRF